MPEIDSNNISHLYKTKFVSKYQEAVTKTVGAKKIVMKKIVMYHQMHS